MFEIKDKKQQKTNKKRKNKFVKGDVYKETGDKQ